MSLPSFSMRDLLEAGVHFGHNPRRWNPKMAPYIFGTRNGIHIINLDHTVPLLQKAMEAVRDVTAGGGRVLFVATKKQASELMAEAAQKCGQYYVNHRWLGGMLTNWKTVSQSIKRLKDLQKTLEEKGKSLTKKEQLSLTRQISKLERALGGIKEMGGVPDILFVIDTLREITAIKEANKLGIPVIAVIDSNSDPDGIDYPIPGNDDATRSIEFYTRLISGSILEGLQNQMIAAGVDIGENAEALKGDFSPEDFEGKKVHNSPKKFKTSGGAAQNFSQKKRSPASGNSPNPIKSSESSAQTGEAHPKGNLSPVEETKEDFQEHAK